MGAASDQASSEKVLARLLGGLRQAGGPGLYPFLVSIAGGCLRDSWPDVLAVLWSLSCAVARGQLGSLRQVLLKGHLSRAPHGNHRQHCSDLVGVG